MIAYTSVKLKTCEGAMKSIIILLCAIFLTSYAGEAPQDIRRPLLKNQLKIKPYRVQGKTPGSNSAEDWRAIIDNTWESVLSKEQMLDIFDKFWGDANKSYAAFNYLDINWNSYRSKYRPEVEAGVSRGRFAAIMDRLSLALMEDHTYMRDTDVYSTKIEYGTPLFVFGGVEDVSHFGGAVTLTEDSSLIFYDVVDNHPLGIEPGDEFIGFDGKVWKDSYREIFDIGFPITKLSPSGASLRGREYSFLTSGPMNWHLFDSLTIVKYQTQDTLVLSVQPLINATLSLTTFPQLNIPGVEEINYIWYVDSLPRVRYGIIDQTSIGYIAVYDWWDASNVKKEFREAINILTRQNNISGLIIDYRFNAGGLMTEAYDGYNIIFNKNKCYLSSFRRQSASDRLKLTLRSECSSYLAPGNSTPEIFDHPIAMLTSYQCWSAGDFNAYRLQQHPYTRSFGLNTGTAFIGESFFYNEAGSYRGRLVYQNTGDRRFPGEYMIHRGFNVDEQLWLTKEDIVNDEDAVVKRAIEWIQNKVYPYHVVTENGSAFSGSKLAAKVHLHNPNAHDVTVWAYLQSTQISIVDSIQLSLSDSNLYSGYFNLPPTEDNYSLTFKSRDLGNEEIQILPDVNRFSSKGPVFVDNIVYSTQDTIANPGDKMRFKLYLKNNGSTASINNIKAELIQIDSCVTPLAVSNTTIKTLEPGASRKMEGTYSVKIEGECDQSGLHAVQVNISEGNNLYWVDTVYFDVVSGLAESTPTLPKNFALLQNYPNPFNPVTTIRYDLKNKSNVQLTIYDLAGRAIKTLVNQTQNAGRHAVEFDASGLSSGIYVYRIKTSAGFVASRKMVVLK